MKEEGQSKYRAFASIFIIVSGVIVGAIILGEPGGGELPYDDIEQDSNGNYHKAYISNDTGNYETYYTNDIGGDYPQDWNPPTRITNTAEDSFLLDLGIYLVTDTIFIIWKEVNEPTNTNLTYYTLSRDYGANWTEPWRSYENISLKYAIFDPLVGEPDVPPYSPPNDTAYYIVQFKTPIIQEWYDGIKATGGIIYGSTPNHAYDVKMNDSVKENVSKLPFVRWIGIFHPIYKLQEKLRIIVEEGGSGENITIDLMVFDNIDSVVNQIIDLGGIIEKVSDPIIRVTIEDTKLYNIALILDVCWMEEMATFTIGDPPSGFEEEDNDDNIDFIKYINGDWNVSDTQTYSDETIILTGNLNILNGGNLTFSNVTLMMNNTQSDAEYNIEVFRGGTFYILNGSVITDSAYDIDDDSSSDYNFIFWVREGSNFTMKDSELHNSGNSYWGGGLIIYSHGVLIDNNLISNCYKGIDFRNSSYSNAINNRIQNSKVSGISSFFNNGNIIVNNEINNTRNGISLSGSINHNISGNVIYNTKNGIATDQGSIMDTFNGNIIHDNEYGIKIPNGLYGCSGATMNNNTIYNNSKVGMFLNPMFVGSFEGNQLNNNSIGVEISWAYDTQFKNMTITDSDIGIKISGSENNSFINSSISNSNDYDVYFTKDVIDTDELTFLNTTFDKSKVYFEDYRSNLTTQWYLHVYASYMNDSPMSGANVEVHDSNHDLVGNGTIDENGFLKWLVVTEYIQNRSTDLNFNPHNVSVTKDDQIFYAVPEPVIDSTMQVNIPPKPLHHIRIVPNEPNSFNIGNTQTFTVTGWDDPQENRLNTTWQPVWRVEGDIGEIRGDEYTITFKAKNRGDGKIICSDETTGISDSIEVHVEGKPDGEFSWLWVVLVALIIIAIAGITYRIKKKSG